MTEDFDKEIDALLRQAAQGESAFSATNSAFGIPHLNADEISLFAENALPAKFRQTAVAHFADCDRCRKILSNVIAENAQVETVSNAAPIEVFAHTAIPWYRRIFAFPNLAYTLGAFVVLFAGIIAFTVLQTVKTTQNAEVSQISERQLNGKGASSDGEASIVASPNFNTMMSNASMSNSSSASSSSSAMANTAKNSAAIPPATNSTANASTKTDKSGDASNQTTENETQSDDAITSKQVSELPVNGRATNNLTLQKSAEEKKAEQSRTDNNESVTVNAPPQPDRTANSTADAVSDSAAPKAKSAPSAGMVSIPADRRNSHKVGDKSAEIRKFGDKTFERKDNVWIDAAYKNQPIVNVARGTETFIRLDSGLRSIAENLSGTIIVVWKDKAYRIQ